VACRITWDGTPYYLSGDRLNVANEFANPSGAGTFILENQTVGNHTLLVQVYGDAAVTGYLRANNTEFYAAQVVEYAR
jgi:hypothetical protein